MNFASIKSRRCFLNMFKQIFVSLETRLALIGTGGMMMPCFPGDSESLPPETLPTETVTETLFLEKHL
jgi:hypothetical protein